MLLFPTKNGLYDIDSTIIEKNDYQLGDSSGKLPLYRYNIVSEIDSGKYTWQRNGNIYILIFIQRYLPLKAMNNIKLYLETNVNHFQQSPCTVFASPDGMPTVSELRDDLIQFHLREVVLRQFHDYNTINEKEMKIK